MMRRTCSALVLAALAAPAVAQDRLSWSYWDAAYLNSELEVTTSPPPATPDPDADEVEGFRLGGSVGAGRHVNLFLDYQQRNPTSRREGFSSAGLGLHTADRTFQLFLNGSYERYEFDHDQFPGADFDEDGWGAEAGLRWALRNLELSAAYKYMDFGKFVNDSDFTGSRYRGGLALQLSPNWSLAAEYAVRIHEFEDSASSVELEYSEWTVGFRRYFATDTDRYRRKGGLIFNEDSGDEAAAADEAY
jgi:hypothetical protein